ncbi:cysteine desulfurase [Thermoleophilum album]|uniref:cysteine desulfurase n=1 Tax=Thermoleophilum album TaxID=29539 RepID=UPI00237D2945|nr:cysteine desulfurase [Thermoleophilum album]WDT93192.1 cysteine desulfurase [Thermoleophilum album]
MPSERTTDDRLASGHPAPAATAAPKTLAAREDFPLLATSQNGRRLAYLDSAATAQKPAVVLSAIDDYFRRYNANVHRGVYRIAAEATDRYEAARHAAAELVGADPRGTVFTRNATEAINLVAYSWARHELAPGDEVVLTVLEHHSNIVPWQLVCAERGAKLRYLPLREDGTVALDALDELLASGRVRLVAVTHVSNVLGTILPVAEIARRARAAGALTLVDGAQAVPHMPVDVAAIGADFYVWTGHKALGPTGIGLLHAAPELLERMPPFLGGGHMIKRVELDRSTFNDPPWKFEAGTSPIAEAIGLHAAIDYLRALDLARVREHERELTRYALARLAELPFVHVPGPPADERAGVVSFTLDGVHPHDVAEICDRHAVCVRAGHHCAQPLMRELGVTATTRASFHVYNDASDVDRLCEALVAAHELFTR